MSKHFALIGLLALGLAQLACSVPFLNDTLIGSGNVITETRAVSGFDEIVLTGSGDAEIVFGEAEGLVIEAEDNLVPLITSEVRGGQLIIGWKPNTDVSPTRPIRFTITLRELKAVEITGSADVTIPPQDAEQMTFTISGSGGITASGTVAALTARVFGSGTINAGDLEAQSADVEVPGSGTVTVWAIETLDATITGSGTVRYYGQPATVRESVTGSGEVSSLGDK